MKGSSRSVLFGVFIVLLSVAFYRPLPANFTDSILDRSVMYFMEAVLRISYVYPTRLCSDAYCELYWTRFALERLLVFVNPWTSYDRELRIETVDMDSVRVRVYEQKEGNRTDQPAVIFIHGGGFVMGNIDMYESIMRQFARDTKMVVLSVDYRLAPEHVFPAGLDDCERVVVHLLKDAHSRYGVDPSRVALMGDSAGGGLVASLTHRLRHRNDIPQPKAQILIYPLVQLNNLRTPSYEYFYREMDGTAFVDPELVAQYYLMYAGINVQKHSHLARTAVNNGHISPKDRQIVEQFMDLDRLPPHFRMNHNGSLWTHDEDASRLLSPFLLNPEFAPLMQPDLRDLPRALVVTCEYDVLRDEGAVYADRLKEAGVLTTWKHFPTGFHAMLNFHSTLGTATRGLNYITQWMLKNV